MWSHYAGLQLAEVSTAGFQFPAELFKGPVGPRNQGLPLGQRSRHAEGLPEFTMNLDNSRRARMASSVEHPEVNPDCSNLLLLRSRGSILLSSTWEKTLPETDSSVIVQLLS